MKAAEIKQKLLEALEWPDGCTLVQVLAVLQAAKAIAVYMHHRHERVELKDYTTDARVPVNPDDLLKVDPAIIAAAFNFSADIGDLSTALHDAIYKPYGAGEASPAEPEAGELRPLAEPIGTTCKACDAMMLKIQLVSGSWMPLDAEPQEQDGKRVLVYIDGTMGKHHATDKTALGYVSHFATCPQADRFRRKK